MPSLPLSRRVLLAGCVLTGLALLGAPSLDAQRATDFWITTWATALVAGPASGAAPIPPLAQHTVRQILHTGMGGSSARVVVSNRFGHGPLILGAGALAVRGAGAAIVQGSSRPLTFSGQRGVTVAPGQETISDEVDLFIPSLADVVVDLFVERSSEAPGELTWHPRALGTGYVARGNVTGATGLNVAATLTSWVYLARLDVIGNPGSATIAVVGASLTDGVGSTPGEDRRWTDRLAARLTAWNSRLGVGNLGLAGNRFLTDDATPYGDAMVTRVEREGLALPRTQFLIVQPGANDILRHGSGPLPAADALIAAHRALVELARRRGVPIAVVTMLPFGGASGVPAGGEAIRQTVNAWLRSPGSYDFVLDADALLRDPARPATIKAEYDAGDHLHPNDAGHTVIAEAMPMEWFGPPSNRR